MPLSKILCYFRTFFSRFPIPDSRLPIPDSRFPIPDSRFPIPDSRFPTLPRSESDMISQSVSSNRNLCNSLIG
ncbi:hypothetical protein [Moorena producens]|uniref:hypothetical protein n=1 Tax=Moorena producens TaxID=1155739 RepID=UPI001314F696|nr:hypothetical protein [Moorena producens]